MRMATWDDVDRIALALPEAFAEERRGLRTWKVRKKTFAWERPFRKSDLRALGDAAPDGPILATRVEHLVAKDALLADDRAGAFFTIPHFDGFAAVLIKLDEVALEDLEEAIVEGWLSQAPKRLADAYLSSR